MSQEFLELIGIVIGDGNLWSDKYHKRVEITGDPIKDREYFHYISNLIKGFTNNKVAMKERSNGIRIRVSSKKFYDKFIDFGMHPRKDKIENLGFLKNVMLNNRIPIIRGLMDTDGSVVKRFNKQVFMEISTSSKYLSNWLDESLKGLGFRCFITKYFDKRVSKFQYHIWLSGKENIRKWLDLIGLSNKYKLEKALEIIRDSPVRDSNNYVAVSSIRE